MPKIRGHDKPCSSVVSKPAAPRALPGPGLARRRPDLVQRLHFGGHLTAVHSCPPPTQPRDEAGQPLFCPSPRAHRCPPCCCTPLRSSPAPGGTACRAGRSSSWRTRSRAPHICRSPSASRAATWLGRGAAGLARGASGGTRLERTGRRGGPGRGSARPPGRGAEQARHGTARPPGCRRAEKARLGSRGGGGGAARPPGKRGSPGSAPGPGPDPAAAAALRPFGTRPLTQRERKPRGEPRPLRGNWMLWLSFRALAFYWVICLRPRPASVFYWLLCPSLQTDARALAGVTYG